MNATDVTDMVTTGSGVLPVPATADVISKATLQLFMKAAYSGVFPTLVVVGLVCNVFSFVLLYPIKRRSTTNVYLIGLTVCDVWILLQALVFCTMSILKLYGHASATRIRNLMIPIFSSYLHPLPGSVSNYLVTSIAVDRFVAVLFPLKARVLCGRRFAITAVIASCIIPSIVSFPFALLYETKEIINTETGEITVTVSLTTFGKDKYPVSILYITTEVVLRFIPVGLVAAASTGTIISLIYQSRKSLLRTHSLTTSARNAQVTRTLLILTTAFLLSNLPSTISRCLMFLRSDIYTAQRQDNLQRLLMVCWNGLFILNACINFPIYVITCRLYRQQFQKIMCKKHLNKSGKYVLKSRSGTVSYIS